MDTNAPPLPPGSPPQPPSNPPRRRLRRDRRHRLLGGVAAGIAHTYDLDLTLVRVLFVVASIFWIGLPLYVVLWIALPSDDGPSSHTDRPRDVGVIAGLALLAIGVLLATRQLVPGIQHGDRFVGPALLIGGGVTILMLRRPGRQDAVATAPKADEATEVPPATAPDAPPTPPFVFDDDDDDDDDNNDTDEDVTSPSTSAWTQYQAWPTARQARRAARRNRRRSFLTPVTISCLMIAAGVLSLIEATGAADINLTVVLASMTIAVGAVLVASAWFGRAYLLVPVGILLLGATAASSTIDVPLRGGIGEQINRPTELTAVKRDYRLGIGHLVVDLRNAGLDGQTTDVNTTLGIGRIEIDVPASVTVEVDTHEGAGSDELFGNHEGGYHHERHTTIAGTGPGTLHLRARVGAGEIDVHRFQSGNVETLIGAS